MPLNLAILISGRCSNFKAIHRAILEGRLDAKITLVLSDNPQALGLEYARAQGLPVEVVEKFQDERREAFNRRILERIRNYPIDWIALAGYMRILGSEIIRAYPNRIINIHPSLLPAFPGLHAQRQALESGVGSSGCTVHLVDEGCDTGPILERREVPVLPGDTEESLSERILEQEHQLYSHCLQLIAEGRVRIEGSRVRIS